MRGITEDVPAEVIDEVARFRYRQAFNLSFQQAREEPDDVIQQAFLIWALDKDKSDAMLKAESQRPQQ